jgi:hypothetical protein
MLSRWPSQPVTASAHSPTALTTRGATLPAIHFETRYNYPQELAASVMAHRATVDSTRQPHDASSGCSTAMSIQPSRIDGTILGNPLAFR